MTDLELLARIDERTKATHDLVEKQEAHLSKINGTVAEHNRQLATIESTCKERHAPPSKGKVWGMGSVLVTILAAIIFALAEMVKGK